MPRADPAERDREPPTPPVEGVVASTLRVEEGARGSTTGLSAGAIPAGLSSGSEAIPTFAATRSNIVRLALALECLSRAIGSTMFAGGTDDAFGASGF